MLAKTIVRQCSFADHWNHKTVNKTTYRTPSADACQLWAQLKSFQTVAIIL